MLFINYTMSVKSPLRNFNEIKSFNKKEPYQNATFIDTANISLQLGRVTKMIEDSVMKFTKKYLIISTELEEMKREFIAQASLITEYVTLTKKEVRMDKFDNFNQGKQFTAMPMCPLYEQKCIMNSEKKTNKLFRSVVNYPNSTKRNAQTNRNILTTNSTLSTNPRILSPDNTAKKKKIKDLELNQNLSYMNHVSAKTSANNSKAKVIQLKKNLLNQTSNNSRDDKEKRFHNKKKYVKKTTGMSEKEKKDYHKEIIDSINDPIIRSAYILANSPILPLEDKLKVSYLNHEISSRIIPVNLINDSIEQIQSNVNKKTQDNNTDNLNVKEMELIEKLSLYPSKTAQTGLNYLTPERETELINNDSDVSKQLLNMIYSCLNKNYSQSASVKESYDTLFQQYNVNSIKSLFQEVIYKKIYKETLNEDCDLDIDSIISCIDNNKELITDSLLSNSNKIFSYIAFSLEEISDYLKEIKKINKDFKVKIRNQHEIEKMKENIELLRKKLIS